MSYDIIIRFPDKETAEEFTGQMSDGFGEGFCDFSVWEEKPHPITGKPTYKKGFDATTGLPICFVNRIFDF